MDQWVYYGFVTEQPELAELRVGEDFNLNPLRLPEIESVNLPPKYDPIRVPAIVQWWQFITHEVAINVNVQTTPEQAAIIVGSVFTTLLRVCSNAMFVMPLFRFKPWSEPDVTNLNLIHVNVLDHAHEIGPVLDSNARLTHKSIRWAAENFDNAMELSESDVRAGIAMLAINTYAFETSIQMKFIKLFTGLEALMGISVASKQLLSIYLARYLSEKPEERERIYLQVSRLYSLRNDILHPKQGKLPIEIKTSDVKQLKELVTKLFIKALEQKHLPSERHYRTLTLS